MEKKGPALRTYLLFMLFAVLAFSQYLLSAPQSTVDDILSGQWGSSTLQATGQVRTFEQQIADEGRR